MDRSPASIGRASRVRALLMLVWLLSAAACALDRRIFDLVPSTTSQNGRLLNLSADAVSTDAPFEPARATMVVTHGFNPFAWAGQWTLMQGYALAVHERFASRFNVAGWDWNAATLVSFDTTMNAANAVEQGERLADALRAADVEPARTHMIAHSLGCVLAASAAKRLHESAPSGARLRQVTFLDAVAQQHALIFDQLDAAAHADRVENYWAAAPGGFGQPAADPSVFNERFVSGATLLGGRFDPTQLDHVRILSWYLETIRSTVADSGFARSLLLAD